MNTQEMTQSELVEAIRVAAEELKNRESEAGFDDDGFDIVNTISYLIGKYEYVVDKRPIE